MEFYKKLIWYAEKIYDITVKLSFSKDNSIMFIHTPFDDFKIYLKDKERFNNYTVSHKNKKENCGNWHTQFRCRDLDYGIYMCLVHGFNKYHNIWSYDSDYIRFRIDTVKAYNYEFGVNYGN